MYFRMVSSWHSACNKQIYDAFQTDRDETQAKEEANEVTQ
jgi:hypothetical protein